MKKQILLIIVTIISSVSFAQEWGWGYQNNFTINYQSVDFGLKGKVKNVTSTYTSKKDGGPLEIGNAVFNIEYENHWNFNEDGNLLSYYRKLDSGDTIILQLFEYDDMNRMVKAREYSSLWVHPRSICITSNLNENWNKKEWLYKYKNNNIVEIQYCDSNSEFDSAQLNFSYSDNGQLLKVISTKPFSKEVNFVYTFIYDKKGSILSMDIENTGSEFSDGQVSYIYDRKGQLIRKTFGAPAGKIDANGFAGIRSLWNYNDKGLVVDNNENGSNRYEYNEYNDITLKHRYSNLDGEISITSTYVYEYDSEQNWIHQTELKIQKSEIYKDQKTEIFCERKIEYFK